MEPNYHEPAILSSGNIQYDPSTPLLSQNEERKSRTKGCCPSIPCRYVLLFLSYTGLICGVSVRTMFNIALVAMVNFTAEESGMNDTSGECPLPAVSINQTNPAKNEDGEFDWDTHTQQTLIGAFYWGYIVLQIPSGIAAERFGAKKVFGISVLLTCIVTMLQPLIARWNVTALIVGRVVTGLTSGSMYPCVYALWGRWAPAEEKGRIITVIATSYNTATLVSQSLAGILCDAKGFGGWTSPFYLFGGLGVLWFIVWMIFAHDSPSEHPRITNEERRYIESTVKRVEYKSPPWCAMLTSPPVWAFGTVVLCDAIGFYAVFNSIPIFFKEILHLDMKENGFFSSGPMVVTVPVLILSGFLNDYLIAKKITTTTFNRKLFSFTGESFMAIGLAVIGLVDCNQVLAITTLFVGIALNSINGAGFNISALDLAPRYAGTLTGIVNGIGSAGGFIAPLIVEALTSGAPSSLKWRHVFFVNAGIYMFGGLVFAILGSGELQPWARDDPEISKDSKTDETHGNPSVSWAETSSGHVQQHYPAW